MSDSGSPIFRTAFLLDACAVLNLYATGRMDELLSALGSPVAITDVVRQEALFIRRAGVGDDADERDSVDLTTLIEQGALSVIGDQFEAELTEFIMIAAMLDDGEASTIATAIHRGISVVTDDRKAIRVIAERVPVITTPEVIKAWVVSAHPRAEEVREIIYLIEQRARYIPPRSHPLRDWWGTSAS